MKPRQSAPERGSWTTRAGEIFIVLVVATAVLIPGRANAAPGFSEPDWVLEWTGEQEDTFGGVFAGPVDIASDNGRVYVADSGNRRIQVFDRDGTFIRSLYNDFHSIFGVAAADGIIVVADMEGYSGFSPTRLSVFDADLNHLQSWTSGPSGGFVDCCADAGVATADGYVYVARSMGPYAGHEVEVFLADGTPHTVFGSHGVEEGEFDTPRGIAVQGTVVFVADTDNDRIQRFNSDGTFETAWGTTGVLPGQFDRPEGVSVGGGYVYVSDTGNDRIQKFTADGTFVTAWGWDAGLSSPRGLSVDGSSVYVADAGNARIVRFTTDGGFTATWGRPGPDGVLDHPSGIDTLADEVFVADLAQNRVQVFDSNGRFLRSWDGWRAIDGEFDRPRTIDIDGQRIYVADNSRILVFEPDGTFVTSWGTLGTEPGQLNFPGAIDVIDGFVYVADTSNNRVQKFTTSGTYVTSWGWEVGLDRPGGIVIHGEYAYVADSANGRVVQYTTDGEFITVWEPAFEYPSRMQVVGDLIYIADGAVMRVMTTNGSGVAYWQPPTSGDPVRSISDIAVTADFVYVAEGYPADRVIKYTTNNRPPVAHAQEVEVLPNGSVSITLTATDPDGGQVWTYVTSAPTHGAVTGVEPNVTYSPHHDWVGSDSFTFFAADVSGLVSPHASVTVTSVDFSDYLVHVGDFDGDGDDDIATFDPSIWGRWLGILNEDFDHTLRMLYPPTWRPVTLVGDFNGDGKDDLADYSPVTGGWWISIATDTGFEGSVWMTFSSGIVLSNQFVGDFNGDGLSDLANFEVTTGKWFVSLSNGVDGFATSQWSKFTASLELPSQFVGDFNGDGLDDLANYHLESGKWFISTSTGTSFATGAWMKFTAGTEFFSQFVGDFNGDGIDDLANYQIETGKWFLSISNGNGGFATGIWSKFTPSIVISSQFIGDFNGDGMSDLANFEVTTGKWFISISTGNGRFLTSMWSKFTPSLVLDPQLIGDFNGDGLDDLLNCQMPIGRLWISQSTGTGFATASHGYLPY